MTIADTFHDHWIEDKNGCWIWQRACKGKEVVNGGGYGCLRVKGIMTGAHRYSYEMEFGFIPKGMQIRHSCHNTKCVNPAHLRVGTNFDNVQDKLKAGRYPSKLSKHEVRVIKRAARMGVVQHKIAKRFDLHQGDVSHIVNEHYWSHVRI